MSNNNLNFLSNPAFTEFCLENLDNCVLVLEDCETALADRSKSGGYDISNILNLTDGIMGDMMNLIIIATINTTDTIDPALLRKGRLIRKVDFNKLRKEQVEVLSSKLGKNLNEEMVLTDVYNQESNGVEAKTTKIGFKR
jgi:ATP-dependent 26S proteasome regulatory subunit